MGQLSSIAIDRSKMTHQSPDISFVSSNWDSIPDAHCFSHNAMATVFEIIIVHEDGRYAQQAAFAAFDKLDKLEQQLSRFIENSDISRINNLPANSPLRLGLETFECLQLCISMYEQTGGAFDVTVGTGLNLIKLDEVEHTVLLTSTVKIDLGGIGKGYAIDQIAKLLNDWSIDTALINGGCSSVLAIGCPSGTKGWRLTLSNPDDRKQTLADLYLRDRAVGGSGLLKGSHIIDPRSAKPIKGKKAAWACAPSAAVADALSTAFMVMSPDQVEQYCSGHPEISAMVVSEDEVMRLGL
ncbi:MAG: FAD:protein FMN transferase [Sedimentisphaerales bacterium]|nr:FAD:protein FMN transferase [Sedimentisphaerales bacterium]